MKSKNRIAVITGTFATPGVSKNRRLYTKEHISDAVHEAETAIQGGEGLRVSMLTHHGARDPRAGDVTRTAGRVTRVYVDGDGNGCFEAELADTQAGRDVAALVTPENRYLKGVSMASLWRGEVREMAGPDGEPIETADGFSLRGIDFTHNPGVTGAEIKTAQEVLESAEPGLFFESLDEVLFSEEAPEEADKAPYGDVAYADNGFQRDGKKRYPIDTKDHVRAAWSYINQGDNAKAYSSTQLARIKSRVKSAAKKFGINISEDMRELGLTAIEASGVDLSHHDLSQVQNVSEIVGLAITRLVHDPNALEAMQIADDDDMEGVGGNPDICPVCSADVPQDAMYCPTCGQPIPQAESGPSDPTEQESEGTVPDDKQVTEGTESDKAARNFTEADLAALAALMKPANEAAPAAEEKKVEEAAPAADADLMKYVAELKAWDDAVKAEEAAKHTAKSFTEDEVKSIAAAAAKEATESLRSEFVKDLRESGPRRRGLISKSVLEESAEDLYGEKPLKDASTGDLEKMADSVFTPLLLA